MSRNLKGTVSAVAGRTFPSTMIFGLAAAGAGFGCVRKGYVMMIRSAHQELIVGRVRATRWLMRATRGFSTALLSYFFSCAGVAFAQTNYIPATAALINLNPSTATVCAIGSSIVGGNASSAYYLTQSGQVGVWTQVTGATTVTAMPVAQAASPGTGIQSIQVSPSVLQPYINAARISFFSTPSGTNCSSINYQIFDTAGDVDNFSVAYDSYPQALLEMSAYLNVVNELTIDTSNVDNFEAPLMFEVSNASGLLAQIGNPVYSPHMATTTMVSGPGGSGGQASPFVTWLGDVASGNTVTSFTKLALSPGQGYPFAMLESAKDYLSAICVENNSVFIPSTCNLTGALLNWADPLSTYFDTQLSSFFQNAMNLLAMGDGTASISEAPWKVTSNTTNCPIYQNPDGHSLVFNDQDGTGAGQTFIICNPVGQIVQVPAPTIYSQSGQTIQLQITGTQYAQYSGYSSWNFGQPEAGVFGTPTITSGPLQYCGGNPCITVTGAFNPSFTHWAFSNISSTYPGLMWETSGQMVFANDGAFSSWSPKYLSGDLSTVALSVERNIVAAFSRGVANCNNLTMTGAVSKPSFCSKVTAAPLNSAVTYGTTPSDAYWANETNWYPANGSQDYYTQYIHTAQLQGNSVAVGAACTAPGVCSNIFMVPNNYIANPPTNCSGTASGIATSNQGIPMGMGYGFAYDENPDYLASNPPQVPSKLDPIPTCWWGTGNNQSTNPLSLTVVIGRSQPQAAHDFNTDGKSDILWRDTGGDAAIWLMSGGTILGSFSLGNVPTNWSVVGTRDFNGDGVPDLLWRDTVGDVWVWLMNSNGTVAQSSVLGNEPTTWSVAGIGDFNADGKGDILWHDSSGNLKIWFMNGFAVSEVPITNVPTIWSVAGVGDFNGDGNSDILWHDVYGDVSIWEMSGATILAGSSLGNIPTNWSIVGTGDFNGDGTSDIVWRDTAGDVMVQLISNAALLQQSVLGNVATTWSITETGDFNGDGYSDILWLDTSGNVMIWFMNGLAVSAVNFGNVGTVWAVQGTNAD